MSGAHHRPERDESERDDGRAAEHGDIERRGEQPPLHARTSATNAPPTAVPPSTAIAATNARPTMAAPPSTATVATSAMAVPPNTATSSGAENSHRFARAPRQRM